MVMYLILYFKRVQQTGYLYQMHTARLSFRPLLLETRKLPPRPLPQPLQDRPHLRQLILQPRPRAVVRPLIEFLIHLTLQLARFRTRVLAQDRGDEFHVEGRLHEGREGVAVRAGSEGGEEGLDHLFEEVGDDGVEKGGSGCQDFGVDGDEDEEGFVDVGPQLGWAICRGDPSRGGDTGLDDGGQMFGDILGVCSE